MNEHRKVMDDLYTDPKHPEAVDLWACFFAENQEQIQYSNWRHFYRRRQALEDRAWEGLIQPGFKVLDIGCGRGFFLKRLFDNFGEGINYYGLDISARVIRHAREYFDRPRYFVSTGEALPFPAHLFDYIQIISTLEHVQDPVSVLAEAHRVLKPGRFLYLEVHKRYLDPLILPTLYRKSRRSLQKVFNSKGKENGSRYSNPLAGLRRNIFKAAPELGFKMVARGGLIPHLDIDLYLRLGFTLPSLIKILTLIDRLPLSIFKNLEYLIYQK